MVLVPVSIHLGYFGSQSALGPERGPWPLLGNRSCSWWYHLPSSKKLSLLNFGYPSCSSRRSPSCEMLKWSRGFSSPIPFNFREKLIVSLCLSSDSLGSLWNLEHSGALTSPCVAQGREGPLAIGLKAKGLFSSPSISFVLCRRKLVKPKLEVEF